MKISKFVQLIKNTGQCIVIHAPSEVYLSSGHSIYKAQEFPDITGRSQIAAVLDIEPKKLKKIQIEEERCKSREDVFGYNFSEGSVTGEMEITKLETAAVVDGNIYAAFRCENNELIFFDEQLLAPLKDRIKDEGAYLNYTVRMHPKGHKYIVVKDGFEVLAAILPVNVLSERYLKSLREFSTMCMDQYELEKEAALRAARIKEYDTREEAATEDNE